MTITVIIPTLNESSIIAQTIRHTAALGFDQIIVVDGGSRDQTRAVAEQLGLAQVHDSEPGRGQQLNAGAQKSRYDILLFLHADTQLPDTARASIESALADMAVIGGRFDVRFDSHSVWAFIISRFMNIRSRLTRISTGDQAMFIRRTIFEQLGGFSDIPLMEDIELSSRLKRVGPTVALRDTVTTSFRRWEQQGPVKTILLMWAIRFLYWMGVKPHRLQKLYATIR
ncbi:MAG TPA: TIGR04283 family arsenosugar biosynthesis glycosyltransferase [Nitrospira sp.]